MSTFPRRPRPPPSRAVAGRVSRVAAGLAGATVRWLRQRTPGITLGLARGMPLRSPTTRSPTLGFAGRDRCIGPVRYAYARSDLPEGDGRRGERAGHLSNRYIRTVWMPRESV